MQWNLEEQGRTRAEREQRENVGRRRGAGRQGKPMDERRTGGVQEPWGVLSVCGIGTQNIVFTSYHYGAAGTFVCMLNRAVNHSFMGVWLTPYSKHRPYNLTWNRYPHLAHIIASWPQLYSKAQQLWQWFRFIAQIIQGMARVLWAWSRVRIQQLPKVIRPSTGGDG